MRMVAIPLALATFAAGSVLCPAATLTVDCAGGGEYLTIQEAVDSATSGDTLLIAPCVYEESVATLDKRLTFIGSGAEVTELRWSGDDPTLEFGDGNVHMQFRISDMRISREPVSASAIKWDDGHLELESCVINGLVRNWDDRGGVTVSN